jgi:hypothetical protein
MKEIVRKRVKFASAKSLSDLSSFISYIFDLAKMKHN